MVKRKSSTNKKSVQCNCYPGMRVFVLGVLILFNSWWGLLTWPVFIGLLLALGGLYKYVKHG